MVAVNWISIPEYSGMIQKTPQYIRKIIKQGKISKKALRKKGTRFLVNPVQADQDLLENTSHKNKKPVVKHTDPQPKKKRNPTETETKEVVKKAGLKIVPLAEAQKNRANYEAALKKLELEEKTGELVSAEKVSLEFFNIARRVRDSVLNIPSRIGAELASITDVHLVNEKLTTELNATLEELSR